MLILGLAIVTLPWGCRSCLSLARLLAYLYRQDILSSCSPSELFVGMDSFVLLAIPFYVLMGNIMSQGLVTDILVKWAKTIVGRIRGGLAAATVIVEIIFSGISGSGSADASALGSVLIPAMEKERIRQGFRGGRGGVRLHPRSDHPPKHHHGGVRRGRRVFDRGVVIGRDHPGPVNGRRGHPHHPLGLRTGGSMSRADRLATFAGVFPTRPGRPSWHCSLPGSSLGAS